MKQRHSSSEQSLKRLQLFIYLTPVLGFFPSLWTLYRQQGDRDIQKVSRLSVTLALGWLLAYSLLSFGSTQTSEILMLRLSLLNAMLTSSYFLVSLGLMIRLWQNQSVRLPGVSKIAEGLVRKHLS